MGQQTHFRKVDAKSIHVHAVEEAGETLVEPTETLVHQLQMHKVGFKISHGVGKLGKSGLEGVQWE